MAKAKPKKAAKPKAKPKPKPKAKPKPKPKLLMPATPPPPPPAGTGKPLIVRSLDDSGNGVESWVAIEVPAGYPTDPGTGLPLAAATDVSDSAGPTAFLLDTFNFNGALTIMYIGFFSTSSTAALGDSGTLSITLSNPPSGVPNPLNIPVDYIDDDNLP